MPAHDPADLAEMAQGYAEERYFGDDRAAAEYAYALAVRYRDSGATAAARHYAAECLRLATVLSARSLDEVASSRTEIGGVPLPERFHDGVVRTRLADLLSPTDGNPGILR